MKEFKMDITGYTQPVMVLECMTCGKNMQTQDLVDAKFHYLKLGRLHDFRWVKK